MTLTITLTEEEICRFIQEGIQAKGYVVISKPSLESQQGDRNEGTRYTASVRVQDKAPK